MNIFNTDKSSVNVFRGLCKSVFGIHIFGQASNIGFGSQTTHKE